MVRVFNFIKALVRDIIRDDIMALAGELTYKLTLALFPFLIFFMSLLAFLDIDREKISELASFMPRDIAELIADYVSRNAPSAALLSVGLLVSIFSASSGFHAVIRGINISYGHKETRNFFKQQLVALEMLGVFAAALVCVIAALRFGALPFTLPILFCAVCVIYKLSSCVKMKWRSVAAGAAVTVAAWALATKLFSIYADNFGNFSVVYGSVAGVFVLLLWLNIIAVSLLVGSEINALIWKEHANEKTG